MLLILKVGWKKCEVAERIASVLGDALLGEEYKVIESPEAFAHWCSLPQGKRQGTRLLFALPLPLVGVNTEYSEWLNIILTYPNCMSGCVGGILIDGCNELFTKKRARELIFLANQAGCAFPGKPLVEATGSLSNFKILAQINGLDNLQAYKKSVKDLIQKLKDFSIMPVPRKEPHILVLHASIRQTSNTLLLWNMVSDHLKDKAVVEELSLRNGEIVDCRGCSYETCLHFGEQGSCFYGGLIVDEVYPAIKKADSIVLLCPNYNDSVSANIMAFINRLTALFRTDFATFARKKIYAVVVSGYSGGDIVAEQILDALNCNKNFILPPHFCLLETANAPHSILGCENVEEHAEAFAMELLK